MKRILIMADIHAGHRVGLTHPRHDPRPAKDADPSLIRHYQARRALWTWFDEHLRRASGKAGFDVLIVNGDCIEGKGERSGSTELITADREIQTDIAADAILSPQARAIYMTYGTPSHVGKEEDWEEVVKRKVGALKLEAQGNYNVNGLQINCKHYVGNTSSPMSRMTALRGTQIRNLLWNEHGQQPRANLIIRSHIHACFYIGEPALNFAGWTTPALQGLGSKFGSRQIDGLPVNFGFLVVEVESESEWSVTPYVAPAAMQACEVTEI